MLLNLLEKYEKPQRLAFCLFKYFPYGGLERDFLRIARACLARGHEIHIFTSSWEGEREEGMHLHLIQAKGLQNHTRNQHFALQLKNALKKYPMDVVVGFNKMPHLDIYYAADVCYQARVLAKRGSWYRFLPRFRQQVAMEKAIFAQGQKTKILMISPQQQSAFMHYYQTEAERFYLLPPGIAKDRIAPENAAEIRKKKRTSLGLSENQLLLLMIGSGFKTKGLDRAIRALASLPAHLKTRSQLIVIGKDDPTPFLKLAKQLQVAEHIQFLGGRNDVPDFLLAADYLLQPSYHENTGTAILEALVAGLPVLTLDTCGYAFHVTEAKAGMVLSHPFQQNAFNQALLEMLQSDLYKSWQANALRYTKETDIYSLPEKAANIIIGSTSTSLPKTFDEMMALSGDCYRNQKGRLTQRIQLGNEYYFIKQHRGVGWREIIKNLSQGRFPIISARNEWEAIEKCEKLGISVPAMVAYGERGKNPANLQSFVLMKELAPVISLEELCRTWKASKPVFAFKQELISEIARIAKLLHENGMNHRDFYICHFLLDISKAWQKGNLKLTLIDLHRALISRKTKTRWIIKDIAGLYFSSKDCGLTKRDLYRFMQLYRGKPLRQCLKEERIFWKKVIKRGEQLYRDHT